MKVSEYWWLTGTKIIHLNIIVLSLKAYSNIVCVVYQLTLIWYTTKFILWLWSVRSAEWVWYNTMTEDRYEMGNLELKVFHIVIENSDESRYY